MYPSSQEMVPERQSSCSNVQSSPASWQAALSSLQVYFASLHWEGRSSCKRRRIKRKNTSWGLFGRGIIFIMVIYCSGRTAIVVSSTGTTCSSIFIPRGGDLHNHYKDKPSSVLQQQKAQKEQQSHRRSLALQVHSQFTSTLGQTIRGSITAPVSMFGETLETERQQCSSNNGAQIKQLPIRIHSSLLIQSISTATNKLYGGAQYHRMLQEIHLYLRACPIPMISMEDVALLTGGGTTDHDAPDMLRVVSKLVAKIGWDVMEPVLDCVYHRCVYIFDRMLSVIHYQNLVNRSSSSSSNNNAHDENDKHLAELVDQLYKSFVRKKAAETTFKCREELHAMTRFMSWTMGECASSQHFMQDEATTTDDAAPSILRGGAATAHERYKEDDNDDEDDDGGDLVGGVMNRGKLLHSPTTTTTTLSSPNMIHNTHPNRIYTVLHTLLFTATTSSTASDDRPTPHQIINALLNVMITSIQKDFGRILVKNFNSCFLFAFQEEFSLYLRTHLEDAFVNSSK